MSHFHNIVRERGRYPFVVLGRSPMVGADSPVECACESGELELFHDAIDAGEIDEQCPCPSCERERNVRFLRWKAEQEKAGVHVE